MDYNALYWKSKAVQRNAENKELKKRIVEITNGRHSWKAKYKTKRDESERYKKEINNIKKKIENIVSK